MQSLWLIFQLLFCLCLGFILARRIPQSIEKIAFKILPYFTYILLIAIAMEFSQTIHNIASPAQILTSSITIAFTTSMGAFFVVIWYLQRLATNHHKVKFLLNY
jgi:hypothetical protein